MAFTAGSTNVCLVFEACDEAVGNSDADNEEEDEDGVNEDEES